MAYKLNINSELPKTARATVREQLDDGAAVLADQRTRDPVDGIHDARKSVKKSRSLLRLVRPALDDQVYRRENEALRDAARSVAHLRDTAVMAETFDALHERYAGEMTATRFATLRSRLQQDADRSRREVSGEVGAELVETLQSVAGRVDDWPLDDAGWPDAREGVRRAYRRGRKAFGRADVEPTTENLHELRKRVKDLWYHERLLKRAWPAVLGAQADEAHALSDLLGDDHDLALLADRLRDDPPTDDADAFLDLIDRRRGELLEQIRTLGRRLYAEKPKPFARRMGSYLSLATAGDPVQAN